MESQLHEKAEVVKELIGNINGIDEDKDLIAQLSFHYYDMKARYAGKRIATRVQNSSKRDQFWGRVQDRCKQAGVTPERYMKAQFVYFHTAFGTTPKLNQLITEAAVRRAVEFEGKTAGRVVSNAIEADVNIGALFAQCEKQIREICRAQKLTREEYYRIFIIPKKLTMPDKFLKADPVYQKVLNEWHAY